MPDMAEILRRSSSLSPADKAYQPPEQLLALAQYVMDGVKAGRISSLCCVIVSPLGEITWPAFGMQASDLMNGAEFFRDDLKAAMRGRGGASKIIRAG